MPAKKQSKTPPHFSKDEVEKLRKRIKELESFEEKTDELQAQEIKYKILFESANDAIFLMKKDRFVDCNSRTLDIYGCTREQIIDHSPVDFSPEFQPNGRSSNTEALKKINAALKGNPQKFEWLHCRYDKTPFYAEVSLNRVDLNGDIMIQAIVRDITDRKEAENALRNYEREKELILGSLSEHVIYHDMDLRVRWANRASLEQSKMRGKELTDQYCYQVWHNTDKPCPDCPVLAAIETQKPQSQQIRTNGGHYWMVRGYPVFDERGKIVGAVEVSQDVTEQRKAEDNLRRKNLQLEELLNVARHLTGSLKLSEVLTRIAQGARDILDTFGCSLYLLSDDEETLNPVVAIDPKYAEEILATPLKVKTSFTGQAVIHRKGMIFNQTTNYSVGEQIPGTPEEDENLIVAPFIVDGKVLGAMCLDSKNYPFTEENLALAETFAAYASTALKNAQIHDGLQREISERKRAEVALKENEEKYRHLIEHSSDAIYLLYNRKFEIVNQKFMETFDLTEEDLDDPGFDFADLVAPRSKVQIEERIRRLKNGEKLEPKYEFTALSKSGREIEVEASVSYIPFRGGTATQGVLRDITERKLLEEQLRQAQKMEAVGQLAGGVAHDFNNLLTVIKGYTELLLARLKSDDPVYRNLQQIEKAASRAENLTQQLLAFSRRQIMQPEVINLNSQIQELGNMLRRLIGEDIEFHTILYPNLGKIEVDPGQIQQVIMNLVVNARDAMPTGGKLIIETKNVKIDGKHRHFHQEIEPGQYVSLAVVDTGVGMDKETQEHIFEPFFTTKEKGKGTGLGLATVYGIVNQSGGYLWVYSEPGKGTSIEIILPAIKEDGKVVEPELTGELALEGKETVLVVEDEDDVRELVVETLRFYGYNVLEASHGGNALYVSEHYQDTIHLIITDVVMPQLSGSKVVEHITQVRPDLKVLYMSGYTDDAIGHHGVLDSEINFIQKPFSPLQLAHKVREVLNT